jgi:nucleotide-binding universal stress UspA family protein
MDASAKPPVIVVGVDGSAASIAALRTAEVLAGPLGADVEAWTCWDVPPGYGVYLAVGIDGFKYAAREVLQQALLDAFGADRPAGLRGRLKRGRAGHLLVDASRDATLLIVGRRGHGGMVPGSVSSACVSHAHCPVLVVHADEPEDRNGAGTE